MSCVAFGMSAWWGRCTALPSAAAQEAWTAQERELVDELVPFRCPAGTYNEVASLFFAESDVAIKQLFHFREQGNAMGE